MVCGLCGDTIKKAYDRIYMVKYFRVILIRIIIILSVFLIIGFLFDRILGIGILIGGVFSIGHFTLFIRNLRRSLIEKKVLDRGVGSYFLKLAIAIMCAVLLAQIHKMLGIGFLIGLPSMQLALISTAFNKKLLEEFME